MKHFAINYIHIPIYRAPRLRVTTCTKKARSAGTTAGVPRKFQFIEEQERRTQETVFSVKNEKCLFYKAFRHVIPSSVKNKNGNRKKISHQKHSGIIRTI